MEKVYMQYDSVFKGQSSTFNSKNVSHFGDEKVEGRSQDLVAAF